MRILALEFSSSQRSVAVVSSLRKDEAVLSEIIETTPGNTMRPLGMIEDALKQASLEREQIQCLAIGLGPGSYTGVRVAIALAQGWQLASGVKLIGVSSAECIAAQAQTDITGKCCVVIDAQREEFYVASYEFNASGSREVQPLKLATRDEVCEHERAGKILIGPEIARWFPNGRTFFPRASVLGKLAMARPDFLEGDKLVPLYLRETSFIKSPPARIVP